MTDMTDYPISFNTTEPTRDELSLRINTLEREVERLGNVNESLGSDIRRKAGMISEFEDRLKEVVEEQGIDNDLAKEFADIFEFSFTKTYNITITATWSGTVEVPFGADVDDLSVQVDYPTTNYDSDEFDLNVDEDGVEIETTESY